jgi:hypothetical protein
MGYFGFFLGLACGGVAIWFGKDWLIKMFLGAKGLADKLEAKAKAIKDAL